MDFLVRRFFLFDEFSEEFSPSCFSENRKTSTDRIFQPTTLKYRKKSNARKRERKMSTSSTNDDIVSFSSWLERERKMNNSGRMLSEREN